MIDLNADLGEGGADDEALLALVTSCNIACGGHAGSDEIMRRSVELARAAGVAIGAHPGYEDRENFGRHELNLPSQQVADLVARQVEKLSRIAGGDLHHVKPHGALYNQANRDGILGAAVIEGIRKILPDTIIYALPNSALSKAACTAGMQVMAEGFADRLYQSDGSLRPRGEAGAVIIETPDAVDQALALARSGDIETLCIHGDAAHAVAMLRAIRGVLEKHGLL